FDLYFSHTPPFVIYTLSLHDALPISYWLPSTLFSPPGLAPLVVPCTSLYTILFFANISFFISMLRLIASSIRSCALVFCSFPIRSEEHTSELQSRENLVCRLLLEKKN